MSYQAMYIHDLVARGYPIVEIAAKLKLQDTEIRMLVLECYKGNIKDIPDEYK